jgi:hypothetical protein
VRGILLIASKKGSPAKQTTASGERNLLLFSTASWRLSGYFGALGGWAK